MNFDIFVYFLTSFMVYRAGPSLSAYNYDSAYGKRALMIMYKGIMEQVSYCSLKLGGAHTHTCMYVCVCV